MPQLLLPDTIFTDITIVTAEVSLNTFLSLSAARHNLLLNVMPPPSIAVYSLSKGPVPPAFHSLRNVKSYFPMESLPIFAVSLNSYFARGFTSFAVSSAAPDTESIVAPIAPLVAAVSERAATSKRFLNFTITPFLQI